jgi:hypothetical protein
VTTPKLLALLAAIGAIIIAAPLWLPILGTGLAVDEPLHTADVALVLEGTGTEALDVAECWRQQGTVRDVVIVEAPVKTHALVAYWSDFVRWGLAPPAPTPSEHLRAVRAASTQAGEQARAALPVLDELGARTALVPGGGGIGSRLVERELDSVFGPRGIQVSLVRYGEGGRDPARWYQNAEDRRAVLDSWLQRLVPFLSGYDPAIGS